MDSQLITYWLPFIASIITIGVPVIKLNSTITNLDATLKNVIERQNEDRGNNKEISKKVENHEERIIRIESKEVK